VVRGVVVVKPACVRIVLVLSPVVCAQLFCGVTNVLLRDRANLEPRISKRVGDAIDAVPRKDTVVIATQRLCACWRNAFALGSLLGMLRLECKRVGEIAVFEKWREQTGSDTVGGRMTRGQFIVPLSRL
jgi:hypothetical protein